VESVRRIITTVVYGHIDRITETYFEHVELEIKAASSEQQRR